MICLEKFSIGDVVTGVVPVIENAKIIGIDCNGHYKLSIKAIESENSNINKIKETRNGAVNLFKCLDDWIDFSLDEIEKNNKNL